MAKEKVLITGGAGYLGSVMTGHLLEKGFKVTCLDNLMYRQRSLTAYAHNPDFDFKFGDVRDKGLLGKLVPQFDILIPLAAIVGMPACDRDPAGATAINRDAVISLNSLRSKDQKVVYPNTNSGYGLGTGEKFCTEETPMAPISTYGVTKCEAEKDLLEGDKPAATLRLATVFGFSPRMRRDLLVNDFVYQAMTSGSLTLFEKHFMRNYIHIRDVARAFEYLIANFRETTLQGNQTFNLGLDDANLSKEQLALKIKEYFPKLGIYEGDGKDPDQRNYIVSNEKIAKAGFKTQFSLDAGIVELIKGYSILLKTDEFKNV
jgi:nucleoside-diphosphate-sugar epimerase